MIIYVFDDLRNPINSAAVTSLHQLGDKTSLDKRTLGRRFKESPCYCDPQARFKIMKLELKRDKRSGNGDVDNFKGKGK